MWAIWNSCLWSSHLHRSSSITWASLPLHRLKYPLWKPRAVKGSPFSSVQFGSRWYLCARKSPYALHPVSETFPQLCLWNGYNVHLTDACPPFKAEGGQNITTHASLVARYVFFFSNFYNPGPFTLDFRLCWSKQRGRLWKERLMQSGLSLTNLLLSERQREICI